MFVPVYDDNPLRSIRFQFVTAALIAVNSLVFIAQATGLRMETVVAFGIVPARLLATPLGAGTVTLPPGFHEWPAWVTLLSYMFFHGDIFHLATNMLFLWVFGDNVEDAMGHGRFLFFYLVCGIAAGLAHAVMQAHSTVPLIGASGAVAGVIAAYVMLYPRVMLWVLAFRVIPLHITAGFAIGIWIAVQIAMVALPQSGPAVPVAWWAHLGGLATGALLVVFLRRRDVPLFA